MKRAYLFMTTLLLLFAFSFQSCDQLEAFGVDPTEDRITLPPFLSELVPNQSPSDAILFLQTVLDNYDSKYIDDQGYDLSGLQGGFILYGDSLYAQIGEDWRTAYNGLAEDADQPVLIELSEDELIISLKDGKRFPADNLFFHFWSGDKYARTHPSDTLETPSIFGRNSNTAIVTIPAFVMSEYDAKGWIGISYGVGNIQTVQEIQEYIPPRRIIE